MQLSWRTISHVLAGYGENATSKFVLDSDPGDLFLRSQLRQHERIVESDLMQMLVATGGSAVARCHVGLEQQDVAVGLQGAQLCRVLRRLPVHYLAVVE